MKATALSGGGGDLLPAWDPGVPATDEGSWAGRHWFEMAYREAEQSGDAEAMAVAALGHGGLRLAEQPTAAGELMLGRLRRLEARFDAMSPLGLRIRARLAAERDHRSGGHTAVLRVLEDATRAGDPVARASALNLAHQCLLGPGDARHAELRRTLATGLIEESARTGRRGDLLLGLLWQTVGLFLDGDRHAERRLAELKDVLAHREHLPVANAVDAIDVMLSIRAGELDRAEVQARDCLERGAALGDVDATGVYLAHLCVIRWFQGRSAELQPTPAGPVTDLPRSGSWLFTLYSVVENAARAEDATTCARAYDLLAPFAALPVMAGPAILCLGSAQHPLGVAALTAGRLDRAAEHLRAAVEDNLALQHWPALLLSRVRYAQALTRRARADDLRVARHVLATAREEAATLGVPLPDFAEELSGRQRVATCSRSGQQWRIRFGRRSLLVPDSVGMSHLAVLLADPDREVSAVELTAGLGRSFGSARDHERARLAVSKAIRRAIVTVTRLDAEIGAHFDFTVKTGTRCSYRPH